MNLKMIVCTSFRSDLLHASHQRQQVINVIKLLFLRQESKLALFPSVFFPG